MSDMITRVALALANVDNERFDLPMMESAEDFRFEIDREVYEQLARAAIEAMREMTDEMVEAFAEAGFDAREAAREENRRRKLPHPAAIAECQWVPQAFRAAIEAALSQSPHSLPSEDR